MTKSAAGGRTIGLIAALLIAALAPAAWAELRSERFIAPGVKHIAIYRSARPWAINIIQADLTQTYIHAATGLAQGKVLGLERVSAAFARVSDEARYAVAAVNGGFFVMESNPYRGDPLGLAISNGEILSSPMGRSALIISGDGKPSIAVLKMSGWVRSAQGPRIAIHGVNQPRGPNQVVLFTPRFDGSTQTNDSGTEVIVGGIGESLRPGKTYTGTVLAVISGVGNLASRPTNVILSGHGAGSQALKTLRPGEQVTFRFDFTPAPEDIAQAIGGGPRLLRGGRIAVEDVAERFTPRFADRRHPRTAVGYRGQTLYLVTVDGRLPGYSVGMTLNELAWFMRGLGCTDALNLDGGGSTIMVVRDKVVNVASGGWERKVANALMIFSTAPHGPPTRIALAPSALTILAGHRAAFSVAAQDEWYNPVLGSEAVPQWSADDAVGAVAENGVFTAARLLAPAEGALTAAFGDLKADVPVRVLPAPAQVEIAPGRAHLAAGATRQFRLRVTDADGDPITHNADWIAWAADRALGRMDPSGILLAGGETASGWLVATVNGVSAWVPVSVAAAAALLDDFESLQGWSFAAWPTAVRGSLTPARDIARTDASARLDYDFRRAQGAAAAAYAKCDLPLGAASRVQVWVYGDGSGHWLRGRITDARGRRMPLDFARHLDWKDTWRLVAAAIPAQAVPPITLKAIYLAQPDPKRHTAGAIYLDDLSVEAAGPLTPKEAAVKEVPTYVCKRTPQPVVVDGRLDDAAWSRARPVGAFINADGSGPALLQTEARLCWDDRHLYVAFQCVDTDIWGTLRSRDDPIYNEEVVEVFLDPTGCLTDYFEFEVSPHNVVWDGKVVNEWKSGGRFRGDVAWTCEGWQTAVRVAGTLDKRDDLDQHWTVEMAIPFAEITPDGKPPRDGAAWRANLYRIERGETDEFSCWSPTLTSPPNFHWPARFGHLVFSADPV